MKIAIVGTAATSCGDAPYGDESWQIWSLGRHFDSIPRWTRWFEMHTPDVLRSAGVVDSYFKFLGEQGKKITTLHPCESSTVYPVKEVLDLTGRYFTSSIAWMVGLAIYEGAESIGLWGVDLVDQEEYLDQRRCVEYLLGIARGRGIEIVLPKETPLLRAERLYGLEYTSLSAEIQAKKIEYQGAINKAEKVQNDLFYYRGRMDELKDIERRYG